MISSGVRGDIFQRSFCTIRAEALSGTDGKPPMSCTSCRIPRMVSEYFLPAQTLFDKLIQDEPL